jgi:hypothetical protein
MVPPRERRGERAEPPHARKVSTKTSRVDKKKMDELDVRIVELDQALQAAGLLLEEKESELVSLDVERITAVRLLEEKESELAALENQLQETTSKK